MQVLIYLALVLIGIYELIKYLVNQSKGRGGAQYRELQNLVAAALSGESGVQVVYGNYETTDISEYTARIRRTTYYRYAIAFRSDCLWIAPLGFGNRTNRMVLAAPMAQIRPDELGIAVPEAADVKGMQSIEVSVNKCNVTFENGTADTFEFTYWGTASSSIYNIKATLEENVQKIAVVYIGDGTPPTREEGKERHCCYDKYQPRPHFN